MGAEAERGRMIRAEVGPLLAAYYAAMKSEPLPDRLIELIERFSPTTEQAESLPADRLHPVQ